ncbi:MAG TPA: sugar phosphate isomerase/epimerase family protein [Terriglobia bacterium]|nr:sugar phosphate isomerase/epimerase family protein [Terriglobia bacterium]
MSTVNRRAFVKGAALLSGMAVLPSRTNADTSLPQKGILISMLPEKLSYLDRFKLAAELGFKGIEMQTIGDAKVADEARDASTKSGVRIHSVMNMDHWKYPLSSDNLQDVKRSVQGMATSLRNAKLWGADTVLLVPGVVNPKTSYRDAYTRSQKVIREQILPLAQELQVVIAIEEVWNKFLLSPLEFVAYVDEFRSPWIKAYFDVGNVVLYGYPQDWIRTLRKRIVKIHLKDFSMDRAKDMFYWKNLGEGDIDWPEVRKALGEIAYSGYVTLEIEGGDATYLKDVSRRVDRFLSGQKPA